MQDRIMVQMDCKDGVYSKMCLLRQAWPKIALVAQILPEDVHVRPSRLRECCRAWLLEHELNRCLQAVMNRV